MRKIDSISEELGKHLSFYQQSTINVEERYPEKIYVNTNIRLDKLKYYGFDMDYTLAMYKSPEMETLIFDLIKERLVTVGYPSEFRDFKYDNSFAVRGVFYDTIYGNFLKVDTYGHILVATHGTRLLDQKEVDSYYPNRHVEVNSNEIAILSTVYCQSVISLVSKIIDYYSGFGSQTLDKKGIYVDGDEYIIFYSDIYGEVDENVKYVHRNSLKKATMENLPKYLERDSMIGQMLNILRNCGNKTFLLTNSEYYYVEKIMSYLLDDETHRWMDYFDYIIIDAKKPGFFSSKDHHFRVVNKTTSHRSLKCEIKQLKRGQIYSEGSANEFCRLTGAKTRSVIYVGDSIYGDILKSKKSFWKTLLIIPGLKREIHHWWSNYKSYQMLDGIDQIQKNELYSTMGGKDTVRWASSAYKCLSKMIDARYGILGSAFRSGSQHTYFFRQVQRFADLYSHSATTLVYYLPSYFFNCPQTLLGHEKFVKDSDKERNLKDEIISSESDIQNDFVKMAHDLIETYIKTANSKNIISRQKTIDEFNLAELSDDDN